MTFTPSDFEDPMAGILGHPNGPRSTISLTPFGISGSVEGASVASVFVAYSDHPFIFLRYVANKRGGVTSSLTRPGTPEQAIRNLSDEVRSDVERGFRGAVLELIKSILAVPTAASFSDDELWSRSPLSQNELQNVAEWFVQGLISFAKDEGNPARWDPPEPNQGGNTDPASQLEASVVRDAATQLVRSVTR